MSSMEETCIRTDHLVIRLTRPTGTNIIQRTAMVFLLDIMKRFSFLFFVLCLNCSHFVVIDMTDNPDGNLDSVNAHGPKIPWLNNPPSPRLNRSNSVR